VAFVRMRSDKKQLKLIPFPLSDEVRSKYGEIKVTVIIYIGVPYTLNNGGHAFQSPGDF